MDTAMAMSHNTKWSFTLIKVKPPQGASFFKKHVWREKKKTASYFLPKKFSALLCLNREITKQTMNYDHRPRPSLIKINCKNSWCSVVVPLSFVSLFPSGEKVWANLRWNIRRVSDYYHPIKNLHEHSRLLRWGDVTVLSNAADWQKQ